MAPALKFLTVSEQSQEQYKNLLDLRGSSTLDLERNDLGSKNRGGFHGAQNFVMKGNWNLSI